MDAEHVLRHPAAGRGHIELVLQPDRSLVVDAVRREPNAPLLELRVGRQPGFEAINDGSPEGALCPALLVLIAVLFDTIRKQTLGVCCSQHTSCSRRARASSVNGSTNCADLRRFTRRTCAVSTGVTAETRRFLACDLSGVTRPF